MDNFIELKKIRRFSRTVVIMENEHGRSIQLPFGEEYNPLRIKLFNLMNNNAPNKITIVYLNTDYASFLCFFDTFVIPLNYSFASGYFERDSVVLKYADVKSKDVFRAVKKCDKKLKLSKISIYLIPEGLGVLVEKGSQMSIKVRKN